MVFYFLEQEDSGFTFRLLARQEGEETPWYGAVPPACEVHLSVTYEGTLLERYFFHIWPAIPQALDTLAGWAMWRMGARYAGTCAQVLRSGENEPSRNRGAEFLQINAEQPLVVASINVPDQWKAYALAWYTTSPTLARIACWEVSVPFAERVRSANVVLLYHSEVPIEDGTPDYDALSEALAEAAAATELCEQELTKRFYALLGELYP